MIHVNTNPPAETQPMPKTNLAVAPDHSVGPEENHRTVTVIFESDMAWDEFGELVKYLKRRVGSNEATRVRVTDENGNPLRARLTGSF
jgi:hypothetical protein